MAMKVVKSAEHYTETALDEIKLLKSVSVRVGLNLTHFWEFRLVTFLIFLDYLAVLPSAMDVLCKVYSCLVIT